MEEKLGPQGILVEKTEDVERKLASGIIIPQTQKVSRKTGKVVAVGKGTMEEPMEVRVGDVIHYREHASRNVEIENKMYGILDAKDCLYIEP